MAAKNKHHKKSKLSRKVTSKYEENNMEAEEDGDTGDVEDENRAKKDEEELSLDEVLHLGGTRADYIMLAAMEDSAELVDGGGGKQGAIDDLEEGELEKFISKLGIRGFSEHQLIAETPESSVAGAGRKESKKAKKAPSEEPKTQEIVKKAKDSQTAGRKKVKVNNNVFEFQQRQVLLIKPGQKWFNLEYSAEGTTVQQDPSLVSQYKTLAQRLLESEAELYRTKKNLQKGANSNWMKTVVSSGTLGRQDGGHDGSDPGRSAAHTRKRGSRRMGLMAVDTLRELLLSDLLPEHRKLRPFNQRPFDQLEEKSSGNRDSRDRRLILWYFEHLLKHHVAQFVEALDTVAHDTVQATKAKALTTAHELLCSRPEQEKALLTQVVNKLGDPEYKTAAKASYLLETLLHKHPNMKAVVCCEVERLMFRANVSSKAQYYSVCFLSQVKLTHSEAELATKLITIYFSFFRTCVKKKDVESKMLSVLLSGVNRAFPYSAGGDEKVKEQLDTLFRVVHVVKFNTAVQALMLLFQVMDSEQTVSDRYYVALYRKLLDPGLGSSSRQNMFLNLLYKSLKADIVLRRVKAFVKRLLQVSAEQNPSFVCGALFLTSELMKAKPGLKLLLQGNRDEEDEEFKDLTDDDEECFVDADKEEDGVSVEPEEAKPAASWVHHQNLEGLSHHYEPLHRNPLFCGADHATLWELRMLSLHFHPSASLFAKAVLQGESIEYSGDPLRDFTLIRFLDRFVFRNPKQLKGKRTIFWTDLKCRCVFLSSVNCEEFLSKDESQIPVDEIFFYRFFKKRQQEKIKRRPKADGDEESVEDVDDEEFEKILDLCEGDSYFTDVAEDQLDFAGHVKAKTKKSEESDDSDVDDLDDEEISLGSMDEEDFEDELEEEGGMFMDPDDDDDEDSDDQEAVPDLTPRKKGKRKSYEELDFSGSSDLKPGKKKKGTPTFALAEEFGALLDENAGSKFENIGLNAMANTDKAGLKQLKWEVQRDDWIQGRDAKSLRRRKTTFRKRKMAGGKHFGKKK
ncbi:hypothetical protein fugu_017209 [Takifugu bimaculatus]|uniref:CCAAT/enhancer-binding protein zeta n=1 Tax=Takifugu bimaculatus TaxID=433685 RepID=A0A4Z2BT02_9TELE|nr:hypothetical protein fugu_017209 [Takifugu bimaculatus]